MKNYYYAVALSDGRREIKRTWPDAQALIKTCPKGARHKKFDNEPDAISFLEAPQSASKGSETEAVSQDSERPTAAPGACVAFVDGSFNAATQTWGYGVVLYDPNGPDEILTELSGRGVVHAESRNVTGEIHAALKAVKTAVRMGYKAVELYYDYRGIEDWATGAWSANTDLTQGYATEMRALMRRVDVHFHKVKGHSGVSFNERADVLAKRGCGVAA